MHVLLHPILLSYNWPSSPPRTLTFTHIHFLHKLFTILPLNMTKSPQSISFHPFHYTTLHSMCTRSHATPFIHTFIALTLPSCHATCSFQVTISTPHTLDCCELFHVQVCDPNVSVGRRILFLFFLDRHIPSSHNICK